MLKIILFVPKLILSSVVICLFSGLLGCDDEDPPQVSAGMMAVEMADSATCTAACQELLGCDWFNACSMSNLQSALNGCINACDDELTAAELIADAELMCDLSVARTRSRFDVVATCDPVAEDLCANQVCGAGFTCNPSDGLCIDPCEGVVCEEGTSCVDGACSGPCTNVTCPEDLGCFEGDCIDLCFGVDCGNQECEPSSGQCLDRCGEMSCRRGQRCEAGACVPVCLGVMCSEGEMCDQLTGECINRCDGVMCREGFECNPTSGICRDACDNTECVDGWLCDQGSCIFAEPCAGVTCTGDSICNPNTARCERFFCTADRFEGGLSNNDISNATALSAQTQRIDDLTICSFDLDWYVLTIPASTAARLSIRFAHHAGNLIFRLYDEENQLSPQIESNTQSDDEYIGIEATDIEQRFYMRVSSGGGMFDQNRYSLVVEFNLPGVECNQNSECIEEGLCINALCGGQGDTDPDTNTDDSMSQ